MPDCLIALGSNVRPRAQSLRGALAKLDAHPEISVEAISRFHRSKPVGGPGEQSCFLNGAMALKTTLADERLLELLQETENSWGRVRGERWEARRIDLDLLLYGDLVLESPRLTIPHPRMLFRRFVLEPAAEIAAEMVHPTSGLTVGELLQNLNQAVNYLAITGPLGAGQTRLARRLAEYFGGRFLPDPAPASQLIAKPLGSCLLATEIESLNQRAEQLSPHNLRNLGDLERTLFVSDYWLTEENASHLAGLDEKEISKLAAHWLSLRSKVTPPKLIIALTAPADFLYARCCAENNRFAEQCSSETFEQECTKFAEFITPPTVYPIFRLEATEDDLVWTESVAAIEAMR